MTDDDEVGGRPLRGVVEVEWDGWEDDRPRSKAPFVIGAVLAVAVLAVAGLTWWAVGADDVVLPGEETATPSESGDPSPPPAPAEPTLAALREAVPAELEGCVPPADRPDGVGPDGTVRLECPRDAVPELVTFTLFPDVEARDQAFRDTVAALELDPGAPGECALGAGAVHDHRDRRGRGRVACRSVDGRVDIAWTDGTAPVLGVAGGFGRYAVHYRFWSELVGRTDAEFPLPLEERLLDELPGELTTRCERDLDLLERAGGVAAVTCRPATGAAGVVSWVRFSGADDMTRWIESEQAVLGDAVLDTTESACRPDGRGPAGELPVPWLGATTYRQGSSTGTILCFVDIAGQDVLVWSRAGADIGSIAVADDTVDSTMADLAEWWELGGHRP
ncbi:hypothetical protein NHL50_03035 [Acidimicrobiia bacterium EGI L10123]|uniref:hypothetical protein n=1 Tax=Salinilacustrithrix flava TaxID=2957203 RepID=UPI003D7C176D|nr:hypothetical protein [Acidimicrobiia bacterium EGI L10123]